MISKVVVIHGCPSDKAKSLNPETRTYDKHWIPWLRGKLEAKGVEVEAPLMPLPWRARYSEWKEEFGKIDVDESSVLIGHSCGCAFLVKWLGESKQKIKTLILVAPWKVAESGGAERGFYDYDIDESIKERVDEIVMFTADDERADGKKSLEIYKEKLGGKVIELKGHGHYTMSAMGTEEFPELLGEIL